MLRRIAGIAIATSLLLGTAGCREEGPAEKMGRQVDEAVEDAADQAEESAEELRKEMTGE